MKLIFTLLLIGVVSCEELLQPVASNVEATIESNLEELNVDENPVSNPISNPEKPTDEVLVDLDEDHFKIIMHDEDALLAMMAHANPAQVAQGIALVRRMLANNKAGKKKLGAEKTKLTRIIRLFQAMGKKKSKNLLTGKILRQFRPARNAKMMSNFNETKQWRLSFKLYQMGRIRGWGSLIHFTNGGNGNRVPAVWLHPNGNKLHMCMWTKRSTNDCWNSAGLALKKWHSIVMMQKRNANGSYYLTYWIDGAKKATKVQAKPQAFRNLKVYAGDPWYSSPNAVIKNVQMINL